MTLDFNSKFMSPSEPKKAFKEVRHLNNGEIQGIILENIKLKEAELQNARKHQVLEAERLTQQSIFKKHKPKSFGIRML